MNDQEKKYMKIAINEAKKAYKKNEIPVGAVIVKNNKIIAKAYNKKNKSNRVIDHAEILAITKANKKIHNWRMDECDIYITLEPCPMCASAIEQSRFNRIITGSVNNNIKNSEIVEKILDDKTWIKNVCKKECSELINIFFKNRRIK